jgi:hypothetical protein
LKSGSYGFSNFKIDKFLCTLEILEKNQNLVGPACHPARPTQHCLHGMLLRSPLLLAT